MYKIQGRLRPGTKVWLWPGDTYKKIGVVRKASYKLVIEITEVEPGESYYRPGDLVVLPWEHVRILNG